MTTADRTIALTVAERKHRMPFGSQKEIAAETGLSRSLVSQVVNDTYRPVTPQGQRTMRRLQVRIARKLGMRVDEAFPPKIEPLALVTSETAA
jgi:transcriptional regulator with XRE-family HTH domain